MIRNTAIALALLASCATYGYAQNQQPQRRRQQQQSNRPTTRQSPNTTQRQQQLQQMRRSRQSAVSRPARAITARPSAALPPTTAPLQTNYLGTSPTATANPAQQLLSSLPTEMQNKAREYFRSLSLEQRNELRERMQHLSPAARRQEFVKLMQTGTRPAVPANPPASQPSATSASSNERQVPEGTPIIIKAAGDPPKFSGHGLEAKGRIPRIGSTAPPFVLQALDGKQLRRGDFNDKPLVIEFGSITSPGFRRKIAAMNAIYQQHKEKVAFLVIYTLEAHPKGSTSPYSTGEWLPEKNILDGIIKGQPETLEQRLQYARELTMSQREGRPVGVDTMDNATWNAYGSFPNSAFVLDANHKILLAQEVSNPEAIAEFLKTLR